ncbi:hypothetical protein F5I97DRAFT_1829012 [Phlebopus sp. FC_14]|nr:hypothetical protein F5I97DRAFT_1829012 [Phlebopus sp. FC_14]
MTSCSTVHGPTLRCHPKYYFLDASHVIQVEDTLYQLYPFILCNHSDFFADMFLAPHETSLRTMIGNTGQDDLLVSFQHPNGDGKSDTSPMFLPDLSTATFDIQFVINQIDTLKHYFHPAELIDIARNYHIPKLFHHAFSELMEIPITLITRQDHELMGIPVFITLHASERQDPISCTNDWHAIWWNGMGRFLLDGRNPQPFDDAIKWFREMNFGRVNEKCKAHMLRIINEGLAFRNVTKIHSGRLLTAFHQISLAKRAEQTRGIRHASHIQYENMSDPLKLNRDVSPSPKQTFYPEDFSPVKTTRCKNIIKVCHKSKSSEFLMGNKYKDVSASNFAYIINTVEINESHKAK